MELSIFAREDLNWKISLLEQKFSPEKPIPTTSIAESKRSGRQSEVGEEGESIGSSESEAESSNDDLDDFVIPDELLPTTEQERHELNLADSEEDGEDVTTSVASSSDEDEAAPKTSSVNLIKRPGMR